jgi:DNA-binding transcriptional LysR family regulator
MNELDSAQVFLAVVRANGFTGAARALGRSASTLSRTIAALEAHLDAQLLARTTRSIHLTEAGQVYQGHAERLVAASRAAHDALAELRGGVPRGQLRVSMPVAVGERLLAPYLPKFRTQNPELRLALDLSDRNVSLTQGGFDLAIRVGRPKDTSLRALLLGRVTVLVVASPAYLEARGVPKKPADITKHDCISVPLGPNEWFLRRAQRKVRVPIDGVIQTTSPVLAVQMALNGQGLIRTTEWNVRAELERGSLVPVLPHWSLGAVPVYVMYAQAGSSMPPRKSRVFVELVKEIMAAEFSR